MGTTSFGRLLAGLLGLLWSPLAFGQATPQPAPPPASEQVQEAPAGATLAWPGEIPFEFRLPSNSLLLGKQPPTLAEGVALIPAGSLVLIRQEDGSYKARLVPEKGFFLPEPMYDTARLKARQLQICEPALEKLTEQTLKLADQNYATLATCGQQFESDAQLIQDLTGQVRTLESRALLAEDRLKGARKTSAIMSAVTGGLVLGAATVIVVTVAD